MHCFHVRHDLILTLRTISSKISFDSHHTTRFFIKHEVHVLLLLDQLVPDLIVTVVNTIRRPKRSILEVVAEFAKWSRNNRIILELFDIPVTKFALTFVVVDS